MELTQDVEKAEKGSKAWMQRGETLILMATLYDDYGDTLLAQDDDQHVLYGLFLEEYTIALQGDDLSPKARAGIAFLETQRTLWNDAHLPTDAIDAQMAIVRGYPEKRALVRARVRLDTWRKEHKGSRRIVTLVDDTLYRLSFGKKHTFYFAYTSQARWSLYESHATIYELIADTALSFEIKTLPDAVKLAKAHTVWPERAIELAEKAEFRANAKTAILSDTSESAMSVTNFLADVARKAKLMQEMAQAITNAETDTETDAEKVRIAMALTVGKSGKLGEHAETKTD